MSWEVYVFYIWVSLFGVFTTSQFWLLANYIFDAREAKRIFPFIGAGAIIGGITGSKFTSVFAELLGTENLLWICMGCMLGGLVILSIVWRMKRSDEVSPGVSQTKSEKLSGIWSVILKSRHLRLLTGIISLTVIVSTVVDYQFNSIVAESFTDRDKLTSFFGNFFFYLSIASLVLQLIFSSRIIRRFGIGTAMLFLPLGLLAGSVAIFILPALVSAVIVKGFDGVLRYSINKSGMELLYLPTY